MTQGYISPEDYYREEAAKAAERAATNAVLGSIQAEELKLQAASLVDAVEDLFRVAVPDTVIEYCHPYRCKDRMMMRPRLPENPRLAVKDRTTGFYLPRIIVPIKDEDASFAIEQDTERVVVNGAIGVNRSIYLGVSKHARRNVVPVNTKKAFKKGSLSGKPEQMYFGRDEYHKLTWLGAPTIMFTLGGFAGRHAESLYLPSSIPASMLDPVHAAVRKKITEVLEEK